MQTLEDYNSFLEAVRNATGLDVIVPDDEGLVSLNVDGKFNLNLQFIAHTGKILCFVEVLALAPDTPAETYRELLAAGLFGKETAGGFFALEKETGTVVYNYFFDLAEAANDVPAFVSTLENILAVCDFWVERLKA